MAAPDDDPVTAAWLRAAGDVAIDVAIELAPPLADVRDRIALLVDRIDRHVAFSSGPEPYPWKQLQALRQDLAAAYLELTSLSRLAGELAGAVDALGAEAQEIDDVERHVEAAVHLARHRFGVHVEVLVDVAWVPPVTAPSGELTLAVARMIAACAASASRVERAALSVRSRAEQDEAGAIWVAISATDNGGGAPGLAADLTAMVGPFAARLGGSFEATSREGEGSAYELRLPALAGG